MQSVGVAAAFHHTAGLLIYDLDLAIGDDILLVNLKHSISLQELVDRMDSLRFDSIIFDQFILLLHFVFVGHFLVFLQLSDGSTDVGHDKEL